MNFTQWPWIARKTQRGLAGALLACALAGGARAAAPGIPAPDCALPIRAIEAGRDDAALRRIEFTRAKLPGKFSRRKNFAWAVAKIDGLDKVEYFAHSGVDRRGELSAAAAATIEGISIRPKKRGRFEVLCVNHNDEVEGEDCFPRYSDTEYKIMEDLAAHLADPAARGRVRIYTDLYPCASCRHVMQQFLGVYTNVRIQVLYRER